MPEPILRQLVFASEDRGDIARLQHILGLGEPFEDPGVGFFGLVNGVFALGDQFLEVVVPDKPGTAAGRFLERNRGEGGYMVIFQVPDIAAARSRADALGLRRVWNSDREEIAASHVHPADIGAAIVSFDTPVPPGSWLWGGPGWEDRSVPGGLSGAELTAVDPDALAGRWARLLDADLGRDGDAVTITLDGGVIRVRPGETDRVTGFDIRIRDPGAALDRAREAGLPVNQSTIRMMGVDVSLFAD